jgi:hypothetical protein
MASYSVYPVTLPLPEHDLVSRFWAELALIEQGSLVIVRHFKAASEADASRATVGRSVASGYSRKRPYHEHHTE